MTARHCGGRRPEPQRQLYRQMRRQMRRQMSFRPALMAAPLRRHEGMAAVFSTWI